MTDQADRRPGIPLASIHPFRELVSKIPRDAIQHARIRRFYLLIDAGNCALAPAQAGPKMQVFTWMAVTKDRAFCARRLKTPGGSVLSAVQAARQVERRVLSVTGIP